MTQIIWERTSKLTDAYAETIGDLKSGDFTILIGHHASTTTRLHELRHALAKHYPARMTISRFVDREIDATIWSFQKMGRNITWRSFIDLADSLIVMGRKGRGILYPILAGLNRVNIYLSSEDKRRFLRYIEKGEIEL